MEYILSANGLYKSYKNFKALNGLSMNVPKGAIYGFVGKNGAGKTTLIRIICGLQEPTSGDYSLYGCKNGDAKMTEVRRRIDVYKRQALTVPESSPLISTQTVILSSPLPTEL